MYADDLDKDWRADVYNAAQRIMGSTHSAPFLVVDKDGTLTSPRKLLSPDVAEVVLDLLSVGAVMAVITGGEFYRLRSEVFDPLGKVAKDWKLFDSLYLISENGTQTCRYRATTNDFEQTYRVDLKDKIGERNVRVILGLISELMEKHNIERIPERQQVVSRGSQIKFSPLGNVQDDKLRASFDPTGERRKLWAEYLKRQMTDNGLLDKDGLVVDVIVAGTGSINILPRGVNKGSAISKLASLCGLSNTAAMYFGDKFGDDGNDADAIEHVGVSVNVGADVDLLSSSGLLITCSEKGPAGARSCLETVARAVRDFRARFSQR
jgi:HAD superfamily hydrolase (TIGR01484 family)